MSFPVCQEINKSSFFFQFQPENWLTISSFLSIQCDHVSHWHDSQEGLVKTSGQDKEGTESCSALKKRTGLWHDLLKWLSINFGQRGSTRNKTQGCPTILSDLREKNYFYNIGPSSPLILIPYNIHCGKLNTRILSIGWYYYYWDTDHYLKEIRFCSKIVLSLNRLL